MNGRLIIFSAPSGAGKSTIVRHLVNLDLGLEFSISATSREPRQGEQEGIDYYFISAGAFREKISRGEFIEWEEVYPGTYYGTLRSEVERICDGGKSVLFDIDVAGGLNLKKLYGDHALAVFVRPPSMEVLEQRLRDRGTDGDDSLKVRIEKAIHEMEYAGQFDRILVNDRLEKTLEEAEILVRNFLGR
jgi:guanylate kinase